MHNSVQIKFNKMIEDGSEARGQMLNRNIYELRSPVFGPRSKNVVYRN